MIEYNTFKFMILKLARKRWVTTLLILAMTSGFIVSQLYNITLKEEVNRTEMKVRKLESRVKTLELTVFELKTGEKLHEEGK